MGLRLKKILARLITIQEDDMALRARFTQLLAAGALALLATTAFSKTTIRASSWHPPKHPGVVGGYIPFMDYVKEASKGDIDFKFWSGGALLGAKDTLPGIRNDVADIGVLALTYFPAEFPYFQLISDLAMLSSNPPAVAAAVTELVALHCAPCRKDFTDKGLVFTSSYSTTPYTLIAKTPLKTTEDLKGKKFRSAGTVWDRWTEHVGGTSVNVSAAEMFEALDRGGVDVAVFSPSALQSFSLWDVAKYDVMLPLGTYAAMSLFTMNQDFWKDLTDEQRRILLNGSAVGAMGVTFGYMKSDESAMKLAKDHQVTIVEPSKELLEQRETFIENDLVKVAAIAKDRYGINDAEKWIKQYRELLKKWEGIVEKTGEDRQQLVKAMQDEIYAKIDPSTYGM
jgi:TRAP-type C4-dicarboxylate transport system substrate-binding protein